MITKNGIDIKIIKSGIFKDTRGIKKTKRRT